MSTIERTNNVGRNDPCPCGSGKKFKKCCSGKEPTTRVNPASCEFANNREWKAEQVARWNEYADRIETETGERPEPGEAIKHYMRGEDFPRNGPPSSTVQKPRPARRRMDPLAAAVIALSGFPMR